MRVILFLSICWSEIPGSALGQSASIPDPNSWYQSEIKNLENNDNLKIIRSIAIIEKFYRDKPPQTKRLSTKEFNNLGFFHSKSSIDTSFFFKLNEKPFEKDAGLKKKRQTKTHWINGIARATSADLIIDASRKTWSGYSETSNGKFQRLFSKQLPQNSKSLTSYSSWLSRALGYDGVILAKRDRFFLIGTNLNPTNLGIQALALKGSNNSYVVTKNTKGDGLLELKKIGNGVSVFELIVPGPSGMDIAIGTKITNEKISRK